jgi:hypothetical protein
MSRYTVTSFFCPKRHARSFACLSVCGFQSGSKRMMRFAPTKFTPTPPVLVVRSIPKMDLGCARRKREQGGGAHLLPSLRERTYGSLLKRSTRPWRAPTAVLPSILLKVRFRRCTKRSMSVSICRVWQKMSTRCPSFFHRGRILDRICSLPLLFTKELGPSSEKSSSVRSTTSSSESSLSSPPSPKSADVCAIAPPSLKRPRLASSFPQTCASGAVSQ